MTIPFALALVLPASAQDAPADDVEVRLQKAEAELAAAEAKLAEQQAAIEQISQDVATTKVSLLPPDAISIGFEGHYRVRGYLFDRFFASQGKGDAYQDARFLQQRLIFRPRFEYKDLAKLWIELRGLDDVVFGDNASLASTSLFAGDPSVTGAEGLEEPSVTLSRVWAEARVPIGVVRVGRMPSDWGMGLLVGSGDRLDQDFGEAHYPSTQDRVLFATRPVSVFQKVTGREDSGFPLIAAVAVDRLVEDPLIQFYGFQCDPGVPDTDAGYDRRCDGDGDGVTDLDHGYQDDTVTAASRGPDWWADQADDVWQMVYVLAYRGDDVDYLGGTGDLSLGAYVVNRRQAETDSNVLITDGYFLSTAHHVWLEGEVVGISGRTRALPLPDSSQRDPLRKQASIVGYAAKVGWHADRWKAIVETGYASGDADVADGQFSVRSLHPDHNVGLLMYEEVLAQVTAAVRTTGARGLWSNGGVYSSRYVNPVLHVTPAKDWELLAGFLTAAPVAPDGAVIRCRSSDPDGCDTPAPLQATANGLGWEVDAAVKTRWHEHLLWSLESGYARVTDRLPLESAGLNPDGKFFTVQSRFAFEF